MRGEPVSQPSPKVVLEPMDLYDSVQFDELLRQRVICGWNNTASVIEAWRDEVGAGTRVMFWVIPPSLAHIEIPQRLGGHISMLSQTSPLDHELANPDKSVLHITSLFILPEHRHGGIGRASVEALEKWAKVEPYGSPACREITIHTLSRRYIEDDGEEWRGLWGRFGLPTPEKGTSNEDWYSRMGYVKWKEAPRYPETLPDGTQILWRASFLRKTLA